MILYPAIDILGGRAVRLTKGDFDAKKVYEEDPLTAAQAWAQGGATHLHVVDLDGAKEGTPANLAHLRRIAGSVPAPVQYGGGLRSIAAIEQAFAAGATRAILGTAALRDAQLLQEALQLWPGRVVVSVDARGGMAATSGWTELTQRAALDLIAEMAKRGAADVVYTDVDRDGMLQGPDLEAVKAAAAAAGGRLIYSGGIGSLADLRALAALPEPGLAGVIVGKALYERRFTVAEALAVTEAAPERRRRPSAGKSARSGAGDPGAGDGRGAQQG